MGVWINKQKGVWGCCWGKEKEEALPMRKQKRLPRGSDLVFKVPYICPEVLVTLSARKGKTVDSRVGLQGVGSHGGLSCETRKLEEKWQVGILWKVV